MSTHRAQSQADTSALICPVCSDRLSPGSKRAVCPAGHSFDRAREGYFNLLLANQKGSNDPGDDREAVTARRSFLESGHFDFLIEALRPRLPDDATLLDAGCGEGYFLSQLSDPGGIGIDISRSSVRLASRTHKDHTWAVANIARKIPVADNSCDAVLSILSPRNNDEFRRVLRPDGILVAVIPGPDHLSELTSRLMADPSDRTSKPESLQRDLPGFALEDKATVKHQFTADQDTIRNLITMTPLRWKSQKQSLSEVTGLDTLTITADFRVLTFCCADQPRHPE